MSKLTKDNHEHSFIDSSNEAFGDECMYCGLLRSTIEPIMDKSQKIAKDWITKDPVPPKEDRPDKPIMSKYKEDQKLYSRPKEECTCHCHHKSCSAVSWKHIHATCEHCTPPVSEGKSFFDLPENEKREIVEKAAQDSNKAQQEFMESNTNLCQVCGKEADTYYIDMNDDSKEGDYCKEHMPQSNTHEWEESFRRDLKNNRFHLRGHVNADLLMERIKEVIAADRQCIIQKVEGLESYDGGWLISKSSTIEILNEKLGGDK